MPRLVVEARFEAAVDWWRVSRLPEFDLGQDVSPARQVNGATHASSRLAADNKDAKTALADERLNLSTAIFVSFGCPGA